jgi:hypothetical protein
MHFSTNRTGNNKLTIPEGRLNFYSNTDPNQLENKQSIASFNLSIPLGEYENLYNFSYP